LLRVRFEEHSYYILISAASSEREACSTCRRTRERSAANDAAVSLVPRRLGRGAAMSHLDADDDIRDVELSRLRLSSLSTREARGRERP